MTAVSLVHEPSHTPPPEPGSPAWLAARRGGLGASEVPAILGLDRYKSGLDVWLEKRGLAGENVSSPQALVGRFAEPMIAEMYAHRTGHSIITVPTQQHPEVPVLFASADRMVVDPEDESEWRFPVEIKNRGGLPQGWGEDGTDLVPESVAVQVHIQMACYDVASAEVAALLGGNDFRVYGIERDAEIESALLEAVANWWQRHMVEGHEPPLEGPNVADYLARKFRGRTQEVTQVKPSDAVSLWLDVLADAQAAKKEAEAEYERAANECKNVIGDGYALEGPAGRAVWSLSKEVEVVDWKAFALACGRPDLQPQFTTTKQSSRSFRFVPAKGGK